VASFDLLYEERSDRHVSELLLAPFDLHDQVHYLLPAGTRWAFMLQRAQHRQHTPFERHSKALRSFYRWNSSSNVEYRDRLIHKF
jgi:hypothetical protein